MNAATMQAFYEELEKIADWSLAGPALAQHSPESLAAGGPHGTHSSASQLEQVIQNKDTAAAAGRNAGAMREAKMNEMLRSGQWNPQTHTVDQQGGLVPKKPRTPVSLPRSQEATQVAGKPTGAASHTQLIDRSRSFQSPAAPAAAAPAAGARRAVRGAARGAAPGGRLGGVISRAIKGRGGKLGLGLAAGLGGFGLGEAAEAHG